MSYQVIARKWRPQTFAEMAGQEHVLKALINALDQDRLHHAYLFTGTRGVGKTTIARIIARCLNCEKGVSATPCGECVSCREIADGRFIDLIEVDAASRTKVEDTRELLENVQYAPSRGRFKVYLIDEVHMLSTHSFNALLKTLEEPPEHVKFILATTDPQKLPVTVLSRCLQFNLKALSPEHIVAHLKYVLGEENIPFEEPALWALARAAEGSMRDAMSLTDQAIAYGGQALRADDVQMMLGTVDRQHVYKVIDALVETSVEALLETVSEIAAFSPDYLELTGELISCFHLIALAQAMPEGIDQGIDNREKILAYASALTAEDVQLYYQIALMGRKDLPLAPVARSGFEMLLLRMLTFKPAGVIQQPPQKKSRDLTGSNTGTDTSTELEKYQSVVRAPVARGEDIAKSVPQTVSAIESGRGQELPPGGILRKSIEDVRAERVAPTHAVANEAVDARAGGAISNAPGGNVSGDNTPVSNTPVSNTPGDKEQGRAANDVPPSVQSVLDESETGWSNLVEQLGLKGALLSMLRNCALQACKGDSIVLQLAPKHEVLFKKQHLETLEKALLGTLGRAISVQLVIAEPTRKTPDMLRHEKRQHQYERALAAMTHDELVRDMVNTFDAEIESGTVKLMAKM